jgi:hypothetical protein
MGTAHATKLGGKRGEYQRGPAPLSTTVLLNFHVPAPYHTADQVDAEITADKEMLCALLLQTVSQRGTDACKQLVDAERLGDIVVGAGTIAVLCGCV